MGTGPSPSESPPPPPVHVSRADETRARPKLKTCTHPRPYNVFPVDFVLFCYVIYEERARGPTRARARARAPARPAPHITPDRIVLPASYYAFTNRHHTCSHQIPDATFSSIPLRKNKLSEPEDGISFLKMKKKKQKPVLRRRRRIFSQDVSEKKTDFFLPHA